MNTKILEELMKRDANENAAETTNGNVKRAEYEAKEKLEREKNSEILEDFSHVLEHPKYVELAQKLTEAEQLAHKNWNDALKVQAEMQNFQRRIERDVANAHKYAIEKIAFELLTVVDNLERCLESKIVASDGGDVTNGVLNNVYVGVELTLKMFLDVLHKFDVKQINPVQENFSPDYHTAMAVREDANVKPNTVLQVIQKGYMLKDRLLRPALVVVSK